MAKPKREGKRSGGQKKDGGLSLKWIFATVGTVLVACAVCSYLNREPPPLEGFTPPADVRPAGCRALAASATGLPAVSMIIPYLNEKREHLLGTTQSILYYTPAHLLQEIIFISDGNTDEAMHKSMLESLSPKVRIIELKERQGLIRAKMVGVEAAKADVLVFMESHCIVNRQWLEPLLMRIQEHPGCLAMPILDHIPVEDFSQYYPGQRAHWRFEWNLNLIATDPGGVISKQSGKEPIVTPATSGGIFAIRKDFWISLGLYDPDMYQWGGDHVEATMKVWRCGGRIEMLPCSRVGHMFRQDFQRPYNVDVNQVVRNYARFANVWLDDYLETFYKVKPEARRMNLGNLTAQHAQRKALNCKSMEWYVKNVDVEMDWETSRICIPGCTKAASRDCCNNAAQPAPGHSTLGAKQQGGTGAISPNTFAKMRTKSEIHKSKDEL